MWLRTPDDPTWREYRDSIVSELPQHEGRALELWSANFYPFQQRWLFEPARFAVCNKSRQTGYSHTTAALSVLWGAFFGETTTVISIGEREATEVVEKARLHAEILQEIGSDWAKFKAKGEEIRFASGGRVIALPRSSGGRSFSGNVFIDEFAYGDNPDKVWDAAAPTTLHGYRMRVASTPNGVGNLFHQLWNDERMSKGWWAHEIPLDMALADGMRVDLDECWSMAHGDPRLFDQFFNCKFLDGLLQYVPSDAIARCSSDNLYVIPHVGEWYAGLDVGRSNDLTSLLVLHFDGAIATTRAIRTVKRTDHDALMGLVEYAFQAYPLRRLCVDQTGLGAFPVDEMQKRYGRMKVEGVTFGTDSKEDLATTLYSAFSDGWLRVPSHDGVLQDITPGSAKALRTDIAAIKREILSSGAIRYDAPRTAAGHADRAWALALALYGITNRPTGKTVHFAGRQQT